MEIPEESRATVLTLVRLLSSPPSGNSCASQLQYRLWMFLVAVLITNLVADVLLLISGCESSLAGSNEVSR
jgi:hypothetical protein